MRMAKSTDLQDLKTIKVEEEVEEQSEVVAVSVIVEVVYPAVVVAVVLELHIQPLVHKSSRRTSTSKPPTLNSIKKKSRRSS
jgi:hypothetical protein